MSTRSPTPPMNRPYAPPSHPTPSAVIGARRTPTTPVYPPAPPSRASTSDRGTSASGSHVAAVMNHPFTSLLSSGNSSSAVSPSHSHLKSQSPFNNNRPAIARSPRPGFSSEDGTLSPPPGLSGDSSSSASHSHSHWSFNNNRPAAAQSPRPVFSSDGALSDYTGGAPAQHPGQGASTSAQLARAPPSPAFVTPPQVLSWSPEPEPAPSPPLPIPQRAEGPVGPVTPTRNGASIASSLHPHEQQQQQQRQLAQPPSSVRSKGSVAETPSGDLANFHLLKGSPLQSIADFDTPTPSPRTPSASPADYQALLLAHRTGVAYHPLADGRRYLPGSSGVSPTESFGARAQRAAASTTIPEARPSFYCRICQVDPCREITATACGHVFCNACIVEEVRENARCPVCNAAVLLFALLKLDLVS